MNNVFGKDQKTMFVLGGVLVAVNTAVLGFAMAGNLPAALQINTLLLTLVLSLFVATIAGCQALIFGSKDKQGTPPGAVPLPTGHSQATVQGSEMGRQLVVETLRDGVVIYDSTSFEILYANKAVLSRAGWQRDELHFQSFNKLFRPDELKMFQRYLELLMNRETSDVVFEFQHDSSPLEVRTTAVEEIHAERNLVSIARDNTERKQDEHLRLCSVSTVSHELRTPLTSIKGALRLIELGALGDLNPDLAKLISVANRNSDRLLAIVNDILTLEKLHTGDLLLDGDVIDLRDLLRDAAESNAHFATERQITFVVDPSDIPAFVRGDYDRLMQVMSNLMSNAAKFSPAKANVVLKIVDRDSLWRVCVEDDGPGIPDHAHDTLFDSFIQIQCTQNAHFPSTGLGLTICREIIKQHEGRIAFDTELGQGTTFYFELEKAQIAE